MISSIIQVAGVALVVAGIALFNIPLAVIAAGAGLILIGLAVSK